MAQFTVQEVLEATHGQYTGTSSITFADVSTDTRTIGENGLFVALEGMTFDGHDFLQTAKERGATGAIVKIGKSIEGLVCIEVEDTLLAYQQLATYHRRRFPIPVIGITGSSGKTTTKEMISAVLEKAFTVLKTEKNYNNEIGVPKMLLQLTEDHDVCVLEMGMRGLGQIAELAEIAEPTIGVITNVGTSHIELLGSQENIGKAKQELIEALPSTGVAILNHDDPFVLPMAQVTDAKVLTYGMDAKAMVQGAKLEYTSKGINFTVHDESGAWKIFLPMIGIHNVYDALSAVAVGTILGVPREEIVEAFQEFPGIPMRQEIVPFPTFTVLNDAYNANPNSMTESIRALGQLQGIRKIAMLGDMLELGEHSVAAHKKIGKLLGAESYDMVFTFGEMMKLTAATAKEAGVPFVYVGNSHLDIANAYYDVKQAGDVILVKGSRGLKMERIIEDFKERHG